MSGEGPAGPFLALTQIVARLRRECPWDREQTHTSLQPNLLEECYEVLEAIDKGDARGLCQELGDLLLQVLLHAQVAADAGEFTLKEVLEGITQKLIHRHPHVFAQRKVGSRQEVIDHWDQLKRQEGGSLLARVPPAMPALAYSQEIQARAARTGFDWPGVDGVLDKVAEEIEEVRKAPSPQARGREVGDLLFALVNLARHWGVDAETALRQASRRFYDRFAYMEEACRQQGLSLEQLSLPQMEELWQEAKRQEDAHGELEG